MLLDCLVIKQPYASLIAFGKKRWEFRSHESKKKGLIGIAASPNEPLITKNILFNRYKHVFPRGVVLATGELMTSFLVKSEDLKTNVTDPIIVTLHGHDFLTSDEPLGEPIEDIQSAIRHTGWQTYGWLLENVKPLDKFIPLDKLEKSTWIGMEVPVDEEES